MIAPRAAARRTTGRATGRSLSKLDGSRRQRVLILQVNSMTASYPYMSSAAKTFSPASCVQAVAIRPQALRRFEQWGLHYIVGLQKNSALLQRVALAELALAEKARLQGISPFCLTIDRQAASYLPAMLGERAYALLPRAQWLPGVLPGWLRKLVAA